MSTSGTYSWSPELVEIYDEAFERCGIELSELNSRHLQAARRSLQFMFSEWANEGILLWAVDQQTVTTIDGTATYNCPVGTIGILDMVLRRGTPALDVNIFPMQRDEYLAIPSKTQEGLPSRYYLDRQITIPTFTLWSTPENSTDQVVYYRMRRLQDVVDASDTADVPFRFQEAMCSGLAARLALKFAPDREPGLAGKYVAAMHKAKTEDRQRAPTQIRTKYSGGR